MSKKKKKAMGNIEIKDTQDLVNEEENLNKDILDQEESTPAADVQESSEKEQETLNTEEEQEESSEETVQEVFEEEQEAEPEGKKKKERKLKWTKADEKEAQEAAAAYEEKIHEANDKYARLFAEFDNFRKRSEKEKAQRYDFGAKDMIERILPVIDNFERGLAAVSEDKAEDSFVKGMEMTYKQLLKALEDAGVKPIEAVGQEFNPDFHNAVMHVDDPDAGENIIVEEFQKGYMYKDHVVRYSMVKVAN